MSRCQTGRDGSDRGSAPVELAIIAPILMIISELVIGFGRVEQANLSATGTAAAAARAASLARTPATAEAAARTMAQADRGSCPSPEVTVDTAAFHPGGLVKVTVTCRPSLAELTSIGLPGHVHLTSTMASGIDQWREVDAG
ncbi:TadE/TadG family type IV pilus assembly protein [Catenulispora pinisilvae]|uniref:TadE/TadG family type IV pilus assembly protein n=1 Tax=Catenulispora pinisilvae TaxID=2705253 RepID=UPI0018913F4B|nr:TadE/TadG family type IV pilus assembly protein [Catenulispora pinisilvae]